MIMGGEKNIGNIVYVQLLFFAIHDCFHKSILVLMFELNRWEMPFFIYINNFIILLKTSNYPAIS